MAESTRDISGVGLEELKALLVQALEENARLKAENTELREEIARLNGLKGRPKLKPSGMEKAADVAGKAGRKGRRGAKRGALAVDETRILKPDSLPKGARFKGYEDFIVQDITIKPWTVRYRRERWLLPSGETVVTALPKGVSSHFGPNLKRFVLSQYHQGQVTIPRLTAQLTGLGIAISKRQIVRLLGSKQDAFLKENIEVLRAGLASASWLTVDDTSARHKARNGFCTHIGNDCFAFFATTGSKSRLNFLELLRAGRDDYVINEAALAFMREHKLPQATIACFQDAEQRFAGRAALMAHLQKLGLTDLTVQPDPVQIAIEAALWGSIAEQGLLKDTVIVSDGASSGSQSTRSAGFMRSASFTSSIRSARRTSRQRSASAPAFGASTRTSGPTARRQRRAAPANLGAASTPSSPLRRALPRSTGFWRGFAHRKTTC